MVVSANIFMDDEMSWMSKLQNCIAPSSTKIEYVAIANTEKEMIWMKDYLEELGKCEKFLHVDS